MPSILARLRSIPKRVLALLVAAAAATGAVLVLVLASAETLLGLIELALYICAILGLSAAVTYAVIKVSPTKNKPKSAESG